jgi:hypothetical protein
MLLEHQWDMVWLYAKRQASMLIQTATPAWLPAGCTAMRPSLLQVQVRHMGLGVVWLVWPSI